MLSKTPRTTPRIKADRVVFDAAVAHAILDEALICHVGLVKDGVPVVIPTIHWRIDDQLYVHGSHASRLAQTSGETLCVTVTLLDGLVLARSAFHHSMNYRSVMLFGRPRDVTDDAEKSRAFAGLMEKMVPGRLAHVRAPSLKERQATRLLAFPIREGSVKMRNGPPLDDASDLSWPVWAGILPLSLTRGVALSDGSVTAIGKPV